MSDEAKAFGEVVEKVRKLLREKGLTEEQIDDAIEGIRECLKGSSGRIGPL